MKYVFFDVECANCLNGEGKICSFGYVVTDEDFNVLKKKDILINPNAKFLLGNVRTGEGIKLAYPLFKFQKAPIFPHFYHEIKELLEDKEHLCFGFAVHQDIAYLTYSCKRYSLPPIDFDFFDIQKLEQRLYQRKNPCGLDHLIEQFSLPTYTYHRSDDDALMSMEVLASLLKENNLKVSDITSLYADCFNNTKRFLKVADENKIKKDKKKEMVKKRNDFLSLSSYQKDLNSYDSFFWNKSFYFQAAVFSNYADELLSLKEKFIKKGGSISTDLYNCDYLILVDKDDYKKMNLKDSIKKKTKIISYYSFRYHLDKK